MTGYGDVKRKRSTSVLSSSRMRRGVASQEATRSHKATEGYEPDTVKLNAADASEIVWAEEIARMVEAVSGSAFDPQTFVPWLTSYGLQARAAEARHLAAMVGNAAVPSGPSWAALVAFRNQLAFRVESRER